MQNFTSSSAASSGAQREAEVHPALRGKQALWSVLSIIVLGLLFLIILIKDWRDISFSATWWMGLSFFATVFLFREVPSTFGRLRMLLAMTQVEPVDKNQPLDKALNVTSEAVHRMAYFCCLALLGLWMAIGTILSKHRP